ncbi:MAG: NYN domain-containing protein, partial [Erysipelotrichaceae bacterium]
ELLDNLLNEGSIDDKYIRTSIIQGNTVPILFGSALKDSGIDELLQFIYRYIDYPEYDDKFKAYLYAVSNDNGLKLSHLKIMGGELINKTAFKDQKINEIRLYNGKSFEPVQNAEAGELCAVSGLSIPIGTYLPGFVNESKDESKALTYEIKSELDNNELYRKIETLNSEQPELNIHLEENHLYIDLKGELHKQIIFNLLMDRFKVEVSFSDPVIRYRESVKECSIGVGHFEPLRHYAEVIVEIKPSDSLSFRSLVNNSYTGPLINYLNTHKLRGILTNSELCRMEITIIDFKTHLKHTEGGDLIQALRRAIRHALTRNKCYLMEPYYLINIDGGDNLNTLINILNTERFTYTVNEDSLTCKIPLKQFNRFILNLRNRLKDELSYDIIEEVYDEAMNEKEIILNRGYDYTNDFHNPAGSVFTYHGAGHYVNEEEVIEKMHLNLNDYFKDESQSVKHISSSISENELNRVWNSLYKPKERAIYKPRTAAEEVDRIEVKYKPIIYLVDGYNLMYYLDELKDTVSSNFFMAREKVIDLVCDFKGYVNAEVVLVFDAYRQEYSKPQVSDNDVITIVYTKSLQTADTYIENAARDLSDKYKVITVTNDHLEQLRVFSNDSFRLSCSEFMNRYENMKKTYVQKDLPKNKPLSDLRKLLENE